MTFDIPKSSEYSDVIDKIKELKPLEISPMEAINILYNLKQEIDDKEESKVTE